MPPRLLPWLQDTSSLTQKLKHLSEHRFHVEKVHQSVSRPTFSESRTLNMSAHSRALVREVILYGCDSPWVYARTVVPLSTLQGALRHFKHLGNKPLGEALFAMPQMRREFINIGTIPLSNLSGLQQQPPEHVNRSLWGRRSLFNIHGKSLLVEEFFLESFLQRIQANKTFIQRKPTSRK